MFRHWIADVKKKHQCHQVTKKSCDPFQQKWKQEGWAPQIHNQYLQSQALVSPWSNLFFNSLYTITKRQKKLKATTNAVDLAMDLLLSSLARKHRGESAYHQFKTTNLRQHHGHR